MLKRFLLAVAVFAGVAGSAFAQTDTPTNTPTNTPTATPTQTLPPDLPELQSKGIIQSKITVDPANQGSAAKFCADYLIPGLEKGDLVIVEPSASLESTLLYVGSRVTANNKLNICLYATGSVNGAALVWDVRWINRTTRDNRVGPAPTVTTIPTP